MGSEAKGSGLKTERIKAVNLARAVRISGDGGREGRHLAIRKRVPGGEVLETVDLYNNPRRINTVTLARSDA